ncbi:hypothetical protein ACL02P_01455 [Paenibacillus sp. MB22_1]|uniref:hypothetical protein n=1 Tax=Paenibacillus sp. MB22_1 TaxID=3383121 RepID=UPI0039A3D411
MFKRSLADIWFDRVNMLLILSGLAIIIYPLYFVVLASVTDPGAVQMTLFWPEKFSLEGYKKIF